MLTTSQLILALLGSGALFSFLTAVVTLHFTRPKTQAEAHHKEAETSGAYVEQVQSSVARLIEWMPKLEAASMATIECLKAKAAAEIALQEKVADNSHLRNALEMLGKENTLKDEEITKLRDELKEARSGRA